MAVKNSKSAIWALLAAGGLYAWKNRDKIQGWLNTQRSQIGNQYGGSGTASGPTRRIGEDAYGSTTQGPRMYDEPSSTQV